MHNVIKKLQNDLNDIKQDENDLEALGLSKDEIDGYFEFFEDNYINITRKIKKNAKKN